MEQPDRPIPFLTTIGLMITYRCTVSCAHCVVQAGPHRSEGMDPRDIRQWVDQIARYRDGLMAGIAVTGGEPFSERNKLQLVSSLAASAGLAVSVVSNAYWATNLESARACLRGVPGISFLSISTDVHHQEFIPFDRVRNAVRAAEELGMTYNVAICTATENDERYKAIRSEAEKITDGANIRVAVTFPAGRARQIRQDLDYEVLPEPTPSACTMAGTPVIFPNGDVIGCIGPVMDIGTPHPLHLGNLVREPLADILERAERNAVLHAIRVWGPRILMEWLREHRFDGNPPGGFIADSTCDVCHQLFSRPDIVAALEKIAGNGELQAKVAYGRSFYLHEDTMADGLALSRGSAGTSRS